MEKLAETEFPIHDLLQKRWSPRSFAPTPVEEEKLLSIFEAARWSPSGGNLQPWAFIVATQANPVHYARMVEILGERNRLWAANAPVLVLTLANVERLGGKNNPWAYYDLGQAVSYMTIQAGALGLSLRQIGGFDAQKAREIFEIVREYDPVTVIALGYQGDPQTLPEELRERELSARSRKSLSEFVFCGKWNTPYQTGRG